MINIKNNYIWVFGENLGKTTNGNSFYLWKHIVNIDDGIDKYLVLEKNDSTLKTYSQLSNYEKKFVLWKNSYKHFKKFLDADLFFVTVNYNDITPDKFLFKNFKMRLKKPFINLQNGMNGLKKLRETGYAYGNNILRFIIYNKPFMDTIQDVNDFKPYQLKYSKYQPKYGDLIRFSDNSEDNQILWFLDDRQYFNDDVLLIKSFSTVIKRIVEDEDFINYLKLNNLKFKICLHSFMENEVFEEFQTFSGDLISIVKQEDINMQEEIGNCKLFISDYSPFIYDAAYIGKPYLIFQPDLNLFSGQVKFYYTNELKDFTIEKPSELIKVIINEKYEKHDYIEDAIPNQIDLDYLKQDNHLDDFYNYFKELQLNKITFLGYNFYGIGGTVNATMALAESLLQKGYWVNVISLNRLTHIKHVPPYGLNMQYINWSHSGSLSMKQKKIRYKSLKHYSYLTNDYVTKFIPPFVGHELDELMKSIRTTTLVSTRETLHLFLNDCTSEHVKNKIFFFHTPAEMFDDVFPDLIDKLKEIDIGKSVFVTEKNKQALEDKFNLTNFSDTLILGNTLTQSKMLDKTEIKQLEKKEKYSAIYLLRITKGRKDDLNNLIEFAKYVKENNIDIIEIDVFGDGDYVEKFIQSIESNNLSDIIHYKFSTETPIDEIRQHDMMIDFSYNHSFGMIYIEAVFNGKKVFCMKNIGSIEVMDDIPNSYIESYEWLIDQIEHIDEITADELKDNYEKINQKYSQDTIAEKFLEFINEE